MRALLIAALVCAALLPACGGDDEETTSETETSAATGPAGPTGPEGGEEAERDRATREQNGGAPSDEEQVTAAIDAVVGGGDPEVACATSVTEAYVKAAYGDEQGCRAAVKAQGALEVEVEDVRISGNSAEATAIPAAGPNEGENLTVRLILEEGHWRVDFLRSDAPAGP
jgi:hypothetical protein